MKAIEFVNVTRDFPGIRANDNISFNVLKGTIHALIGENGAGKSTLMSILFGLYEPTSGSIKVNGNRVFFTGPNDANALGIGMVHQHFKLVDVYTNLDNIILGAEWTQNGDILNRDIAIKKIKALQSTYDLHFDLFQKSGEATVSTQQKVEIMKMLYRDNEILVFDEPTAVLTDEEIQGLLKSFEIFKKAGKTIIFISHKLKEIEQVADYATVLRLGKVVGNFDMKKTKMSQIVEAMVGSSVTVIQNKSSAQTDNNDVVFSLDNVSTYKQVKDLNKISFKIYAGEIFAIAGVEGNGQNELEKVCAGMIKPSFGKIHLRIKDPKTNEYKLKDITKEGAYYRSKQHMSFIPADRHHHGLILDYSINENAVIRRLWDPKMQTFGVISTKKRNEFVKEVLEKYDVRGAHKGYGVARSMSGGNQQKFIVGREMSTEHDFIIIVQPTRGLDIGAINNIHSEILKEKAKGKAILLISYELDEVIALADTIAVINNGNILAIKDAHKITRSEIGTYMASSSQNSVVKWWESYSKKVAFVQYKKNIMSKFNETDESFKLEISGLQNEVTTIKKHLKAMDKDPNASSEKRQELVDKLEKTSIQLKKLITDYRAHKIFVRKTLRNMRKSFNENIKNLGGEYE